MKKLLMLHRHRPWRPASGQSIGHRDDNASFNTSGGVRWQPSRWSGARNNPNTAERRQIQLQTAAMTRQRKMTIACDDDGYISTPTSSSICPVDATITTTSIALLPISGNIHVRQRQNVSVLMADIMQSVHTRMTRPRRQYNVTSLPFLWCTQSEIWLKNGFWQFRFHRRWLITCE